jgi:SAM-dependent methyltransferase
VEEPVIATDAVPVDPSNADAQRAWDGADGAYWAENEAIFDASLERYRPAFLGAAAISIGDAVLDIGCGTGESTRDAARLAAEGSALGVDLSARMLERARRRTAEEGLANCEFVQADAQIHRFPPAGFDLAISRTGSMFFGDPVAAFTNIGGSLRSGGRLTLLVWQPLDGNHWIRDFSAALAAGRERPAPPPDAPGPFSLSDPARVRSILSAAGLVDVALEGVEEHMYFGSDAGEAYRFVCGLGFTDFMLRDLDDGARAAALDELHATIDAHATVDGVLYPSATWVVTATRP